MRLVKKTHFLLTNNTAKIYLRRTYTNIFITLTDLDNKVIVCKTSGMSGITKSKRRKTTPQAVESIMKALHSYIKLYNITNI